jgi:hypothetical protein
MRVDSGPSLVELNSRGMFHDYVLGADGTVIVTPVEDLRNRNIRLRSYWVAVA